MASMPGATPNDESCGTKTWVRITLSWLIVNMNVPLDTPFVGTEKGREFFRVLILGEKDDMDVARAQQDIIDAGRALR